MAKKPHIRKESLSIMSDLGIFDPYLPVDEVWIVYGRLGHFYGWAIVGARTESSARRYIRNPDTGWLKKGKITSVFPLTESYEINNINSLKEKGLYPKEIGEWHELNWSI